MSEPDREVVREEVLDTFEAMGMLPPSAVVDLFVAKLLKFYHQGAVDAIDQAIAQLPHIKP